MEPDKVDLSSTIFSYLYVRQSFAYTRSNSMSKDIVEGEAKRVKGKARSAYGKAVGSPKQRVKGEIEQIEGKLKKGVGKAKYKV